VQIESPVDITAVPSGDRVSLRLRWIVGKSGPSRRERDDPG